MSNSKHVRIGDDLFAVAARIAKRVPGMTPRTIIEFMIGEMGPQMLAALDRREVRGFAVVFDAEGITAASEDVAADYIFVDAATVKGAAEELSNAK